MSLLMEALRKAEEAKSKATKQDQENREPEEPLDSAQEQPDTDAETGTLHTPEIISADPDEAESLAAYTSEAPGDNSEIEPQSPGEAPDGDIEHIEFSTTPAGGDSSPDANSGPADDDELSLVHDDYFSPAQDSAELEEQEDALEQQAFLTSAPGAAGDEEPEAGEHGAAAEESVEDAGMPATEPVDFSDLENDLNQPYESSGDTDDLSGGYDSAPEPEPATPAGKTQNDDRGSVESLFLAKKTTQQNQIKKIGIMAAIVVIPVAGALYWFYSQYMGVPQSQFMIPADINLADRGFIGEGVPDESQAVETVTGTSPDAPSGNSANASADVSSDDTTLADASERSGPTPAAADAGETQIQEPATTPEGRIPATAGTTPDSEQVASRSQTAPSPPAQPQERNTITVNTGPAANAGSDAQSTSSSVTFERKEPESITNPLLNEAYASYRAGDYNEAGQRYQAVLNRDPNSRDAMLGLASVYAKQNNVAMSQNLYARLLQLNPKDAVARAGLLQTSQQDDPLRQESELKSLIATYPDIAPLEFALGNLYARQNRWNEAQNAYFDALLTAKSTNIGTISPDYAFNLAVSLERLNQLRAALDYYREAAEFSRDSAPGFDAAELNRRMNYLEQVLQ